MTTTAVGATFYYDASDELEVAKFPENFADWLMDEGWEQDAREFLVRWKQFEENTPNHEITLDAAVQMAEEYAETSELNAELRNPVSKTYAEAFQLLRDLEKVDEPEGETEPLPWDREAAAINHFLADSSPPVPVNMEEHEFADVVVHVDVGENIAHIIAHSLIALAQAGYTSGAKELAFNLKNLFRRNPTNWDVFELIWSYVDVQPTPRRQAVTMLEEHEYH